MGRKRLGGKGVVAGGMEQGGWGLGRSLRAWGLERAEGLGWGEGWTLRGPDRRLFARSFDWKFEKKPFFPAFPVFKWSRM